MKRYLIYLLFVTVLIFAFYLLFFSNYFIIKDINVSEVKVNKAEIDRYVKELKKLNLVSFDKAIIRSRFKSRLNIEDVVFKKKYPSTLEIDIKEKKVFCAFSYSGNYLLVDKEGVVIGITKKQDKAIEVIGFNFKKVNNNKKIELEDKQKLLYKPTMHLVDLLSKAKFNNMKIKLVNGELTIVINPSFSAVFKNLKNIDKKFNNFATLYERLKLENTNTGTILIYEDKEIIYKPFEKNN